jgi:hypothetical protein
MALLFCEQIVVASSFCLLSHVAIWTVLSEMSSSSSYSSWPSPESLNALHLRENQSFLTRATQNIICTMFLFDPTIIHFRKIKHHLHFFVMLFSSLFYLNLLNLISSTAHCPEFCVVADMKLV